MPRNQSWNTSCFKCGYSLHGHTGQRPKCPECGTVQDHGTSWYVGSSSWKWYAPPLEVWNSLTNPGCLVVAKRRVVRFILAPLMLVGLVLVAGNSIQKSFTYGTTGTTFVTYAFEVSLISWDYRNRAPTNVTHMIDAPDVERVLFVVGALLLFAFAPIFTYLSAVGAVLVLLLWRRFQGRGQHLQLAGTFVLSTLFLPATFVGLLSVLILVVLRLISHLIGSYPSPLGNDVHVRMWIGFLCASWCISTGWGSVLLFRLYGAGIDARSALSRSAKWLGSLGWCGVNTANYGFVIFVVGT